MQEIQWFLRKYETLRLAAGLELSPVVVQVFGWDDLNMAYGERPMHEFEVAW